MSFPVLSRVIYGTSAPAPWQCAALRARPAELAGFRRHQVARADYPGIVAAPGARVRGTLVTGLTACDVARLDAFEGAEYARVRVRVAGAHAHAYVYRDPANLESADWDYARFVREKLHRWVSSERALAGAGGARAWQDGFPGDAHEDEGRGEAAGEAAVGGEAAAGEKAAAAG